MLQIEIQIRYSVVPCIDVLRLLFHGSSHGALCLRLRFKFVIQWFRVQKLTNVNIIVLIPTHVLKGADNPITEKLFLWCR